jgi:hypothetical protein
MFRPGDLNASRRLSSGLVAVEPSPRLARPPTTPVNPVDAPATPGCGNDGSHAAGFSSYIGS